jgi:hypothetical protein
MGGITDGCLEVVGNSAIAEVELGAGMGKKENGGSSATVLYLKIGGCSVGIDV